MAVSIKTAKNILGPNFHGPEEVLFYLSINVDLPLWSGFNLVPWSEEELRLGSDTDIVFLGSPKNSSKQPLTINVLHGMFPANRQPRFSSYEGDEYHLDSQEKCFNEVTCQLRWYRMRKVFLETSRSEPFYRWRQLLNPNETIEHVVVYTYGAFLHFLATGEYLYKENFLFCKDVTATKKVIYAGLFNENGWFIGSADFYEAGYIAGLVPIVMPQP